MDEPIFKASAEAVDAYELGEMLGQRRAFSTIAGRCSAADAACIQRIRERKLFLQRSPSWEEFCPTHLGLSRTQANRIIRNLEEFGPDYFELAQLTRITADEFRAIAPAVYDKTVHVHGEAIALIPENSGKLTAALAELRHDATGVQPGTAPGSRSVADRRAAAARRFDRAMADFAALIEVSRGDDGLLLQSALEEAIARMAQVWDDTLAATGL